MNELLRLLDRLVARPQGHRIIRSGQLNLRPVTNLDRIDMDGSLAAAKALFDRDDTGTQTPGALTVMLRTCLRGARRARINPVADEPLETAVLACLGSLVASINHAAETAGLSEITVEVDDDRSDPDARVRIESVLDGLRVPWTLRTPEQTLAGPVMHAQFGRAAGVDRLVYFVEDDYLHAPEAIAAMVGFYRQVHAVTGGHLMLHPLEQRALYTRHYPSYLVLGEDRRWRTTRHMSHTLFTHGHVVRDHWDCFENTRYVGHKTKRLAHKGAERNTTNRVLHVLPGFCPIPALAAHFQAPDLLPPFFDWQPLYAANHPDTTT
ncbi:hypothetical protein [Rhodospira trueperi]|uniref:Glycosyl transferase family 2 n=1 Tax=Rhodospira trueperi TaxID=69960 RepID=A0A1G6XY15_9PROT|nr:hypothetical protein [Rhodospira trueperi]SDD83114.1 hypothetical protein SAMN05421720_101681 [Rhodospira trueperi]